MTIGFRKKIARESESVLGTARVFFIFFFCELRLVNAVAVQDE